MTKSVFSERYGLFLAVLVQARKEAGLTQSELASRLGKPQSYISKAERGERRLDVVEFIEFAEALGRTPSELLSYFVQNKPESHHSFQ
ncbi:helix-turn-helix domain-containing protein [Brevundimonas sp. NPDC090276]|uniref:helix-turn-helix domain-containing protein n=1 Tax=Brevundimonas sp. NPDC090276 TaxID=3363956 RepID=UPI003839E25A